MPENPSAQNSGADNATPGVRVSAGDRVVLYGQQRPPHAEQTLYGVDGLEHVETITGQGFVGERALIAADIDDDTLATVTQRLSTLNEQDLDVAVVPAQLVQKLNGLAPLLVFDVDSTLITQEVIELLAAHVDKEAEVQAVTERAMRGEIDFAQSLHERVATLAGIPDTVPGDVARAVVPSMGARELIDAVHAAGGKACAVSGGFNQVLSFIAEDLTLDDYRANELDVADNELTGKVAGEVVTGDVKATELARWRAKYAQAQGVSEDHVVVVAVGDGANDIKMLDAADYGVAFQAKPVLREHADHELDLATLDVIRALLGY